jgi:hypothetical protein
MNRLIDTKSNYTKKYAGLVIKMDKLRTEQENTLTALIKEAQTSDEGIDIKEMYIYVDFDGYEPLLVYAIRTVSEEGYSDCLELKVTTTGDESDIEWLSIYDFYSDTAGKVLSEIMEML